ncbi:hypothetical protein GTNG_2490 [Geobacillus thermodenitrificans NG80-2]|uniref:Uncharacterized protein n=1 Tax=Geobacillus thermodenitrificans (strain NG80-2) TaxID=420246 RepID=A4IR81_GEOTN|nr:hypothetical protein GTNG_2490 [Geobacillus thermodenitrificans NG80-2]
MVFYIKKLSSPSGTRVVLAVPPCLWAKSAHHLFGRNAALRQVLPALRISLLLPFIWNFFQPRKFLSVRQRALRWTATYSIRHRVMYSLFSLKNYRQAAPICQCGA